MIKVIPLLESVYEKIDTIPAISKLIFELMDDTKESNIIKSKEVLKYYLEDYEINSLLYSTFIMDEVMFRMSSSIYNNSKGNANIAIVGDTSHYIFNGIIYSINKLFSRYVNYIEIDKLMINRSFTIDNDFKESTTRKDVIYVKIKEKDADDLFSILNTDNVTPMTLISVYSNYMNIVNKYYGYMRNGTLSNSVNLNKIYLKYKLQHTHKTN